MLTILTPASSRDLSTLDSVKATLGVTGSAQDVALLTLLRQASDAITRHVGQPFARERVQQTEYLSGGGSIILERSLAVTIETVTFGETTLDAGTYSLEGGILRPWLFGWQSAPWWGAAVITYSAGYELLGELPYDVERAALLTCAGWYGSRGRDPLIRSETAEGVGTITYATTPAAGVGALPAEALALLAPYRRLFA